MLYVTITTKITRTVTVKAGVSGGEGEGGEGARCKCIPPPPTTTAVSYPGIRWDGCGEHEAKCHARDATCRNIYNNNYDDSVSYRRDAVGWGNTGRGHHANTWQEVLHVSNRHHHHHHNDDDGDRASYLGVLGSHDGDARQESLSVTPRHVGAVLDADAALWHDHYSEVVVVVEGREHVHSVHILVLTGTPQCAGLGHVGQKLQSVGSELWSR